MDVLYNLFSEMLDRKLKEGYNSAKSRQKSLGGQSLVSRLSEDSEIQDDYMKQMQSHAVSR